ncbi:NADPH-dependent FMN reductase [Kitasatospora sp. NPDC093550]|uniref:NADPH-dependent FMN reductase n=1 Tax=Kitasatospora sp. NPDC093550 TaxID=3364089 RepID=UPI003829D506
MAVVLSVSGSPSSHSRTTGLLRHADAVLAARGHTVLPLDVRDLPADALFGTDPGHPELARAARLFELADAVVIATPVYKAAYSGLLKCLLDHLPQHALTGKTVLPLATGGSTAHVLAIDYALRPVLSSMGAFHVVQGWFVLDRCITVDERAGVTVEDAAEAGLREVLDRFCAALGGRVLSPAAPADAR